MMSESRRPVHRRIEIQVYPADIRQRVRYFFFTYRQLGFLALGSLAYLLFLGAAAWTAPEVLVSLWRREGHERRLGERQAHGERLEGQVARLGELENRAEQLRRRVDKVLLAYGLSAVESAGQGGYPFEPPPPVESIYSNLVEQGARKASRLQEQTEVLRTFLAEVREFETAHREQARITPSMCPLKGDTFVLTSPFGHRRNPFTKQLDFHAGLDLAAPEGATIHAPADGVVTFAGRFPQRESIAWWRYGNLVVVRHGDQFVTLFGHCDQVRVKAGQRVRQGEPLATVGNTGWSTSPHLHYEVRRFVDPRGLVPVDPRIYILDHRWRNEERLLVQARSAPTIEGFEPLPRLFTR
jgi:murein DD-endopeptidase MepM/ murein hydrolase activator NlpD